MSQVVKSDKLIFVLTQPGLDKVASMLTNPSELLNLTNVELGDANGEYYIPDSNDLHPQLRNPIPDGVFPIFEKSILEDDLTVSLRFSIPEKFGNCDIREVGVYFLNDQGEEVMFALGTQQPLVKPSPDYNYYIAVDYYIFLKAQNLAEIYDRIYLDPDSQLVTDVDLEGLMRVILFSQTNLMDQIGHNSYSIGLNRAAQLQELIISDKDSTSNSISYLSYLDTMSLVGVENIFSYWVFNYPKIPLATNSITDLGPNGINMSTNVTIKSLEKEYLGITPTLKFTEDTYFELNKEYPLSFISESGTRDLDFTVFWSVKPISMENDRTILARSNYATGSNIYEFLETSDGRLKVNLFTDSNNYVTFQSLPDAIPDKAHSVTLSYNSLNSTITAFVDGRILYMDRTETGTYTHMNNALTNMYSYYVNPINRIYSNSIDHPTLLFNADGTPNKNPLYTISNSEVLYNGLTCNYNSSEDVTLSTLYAYTSGPFTIYTKSEVITESTILYNSDYTEDTSGLYSIAPSGDYDFVIQVQGVTMERDESSDIPSSVIYAWENIENPAFIWANSPSTPTLLYDGSGNIYKGENWSILNGSIYYNETYLATYNPAYDKEVPFVEVTSYITDANNNKISNINSYIGIIGVATTKLAPKQLQILSLNMTSALGTNPCMLTY